MRIHYSNVNPNKLHDELILAGIMPVLVENDCLDGEYIAKNTWITFSEDTDMTTVQAIIDAHDPTPLPQRPTLEDFLLDLDFRLSLIELGV